MLTRIPLPYVEQAQEYFAALSALPWSVWLDSGGRGRFDIMTANPVETLQTRGRETIIACEKGVVTTSLEDPFDLLRQRLGNKEALPEAVKFAGGALGYWGYDIARRYVDLPEQACHLDNLPDMAVGIYDWALQIDHQLRTAELVSLQKYPGSGALLQDIVKILGVEQKHKAAFVVHGKITSTFSREGYDAAFRQVQEYLHAGDCYQVNLAQCFSVKACGDAFEAYCALRQASPAPYAAFLNYPFAQILSASPESFLRVEQGIVETRPIKGTRPRKQELLENAAQIADLQHNAKDRAENLMIVDLLRNDLGKHCLPGSVDVPSLFALESYATVHHLVSTVRGVLAEGQDALSLLRGCFPGGSITGAPKLRAMEIIESLEPCRRGIYCGSIGYIGFDGNMNTNIAIRTLVYSGGWVRCNAGGGIVADSEAEAEYMETLHKAEAMLRVLREFGGNID